MRTSLTALCLFCLAATPARAELVDARISQREASGELWLAFDTQPQSVELTEGPEGAVLRLTGVSSPVRVIDVAVDGAITRIALAPDGGALRISLAGPFAAPLAELRRGGVLVRFEADRAAAVTAEPSPRPVPASDTTPEPEPDPAPAAPREQRPAAASPVAAAPASGPPAQLADETQAGPCEPTQAAIADSPWDLDGLTAHADCLAAEGLNDQAIGLYQRVLAFEPGHYAASMGLGRLQAERGSRETARDLFLEAARNAQTDSEALQARAAARRLEDG